MNFILLLPSHFSKYLYYCKLIYIESLSKVNNIIDYKIWIVIEHMLIHWFLFEKIMSKKTNARFLINTQ